MLCILVAEISIKAKLYKDLILEENYKAKKNKDDRKRKEHIAFKCANLDLVFKTQSNT